MDKSRYEAEVDRARQYGRSAGWLAVSVVEELQRNAAEDARKRAEIEELSKIHIEEHNLHSEPTEAELQDMYEREIDNAELIKGNR